MKLLITEAQQHEMCHAYYDGAPGVLVSGLVWLTSTLVCSLVGLHQAVWTLLVGGALIYPISIIVTKMMGRSAEISKTNALNQLVIASTIWLILCCAMSYGLFLLRPALFFPAMMVTIGSRYLVFASVYGKSIFWILGASLILAGTLSLFVAITPAISVGLGGLIEMVFASFIFSKATTSPRPADE